MPLSVKYGTQVLELSVASTANMQFTDFELWARQRFQILPSAALSFFDANKKEVIPFGSIAAFEEIEIKPVTVAGAAPAKAAAKDKSLNAIIWSYFVWAVPFVILTLLAVTLNPNKEAPQAAIDFALEALGLQAYKAVIVDYYITFLSWAITYLYIRRAANPENAGNVYSKFAADTVFGGLAAVGNVALKAVLKK